MTGRRRRHASDRGSATIETAILLPAFIALIVLAVVQGRTSLAQNAIELAAYDAARTMSLADNAADARTRARTAALDSIARQGLTCSNVTVTVDTAGFARPVGTPASVTATVICDLSLGDLDSIPGVPSSRRLTAAFTSPLDQYRSRT